MESRRSGAIVPAIILIGIGIFFLLLNTDVIRGVSIGQLWPAFPALLGVSLLVQFFAGRMRDPGLVTGGAIFLLTGLFFFLFTLRVDIPGFGPVNWGDMATLWPAFPTIVGVALLLQWLAGGLRDHALLIPVTILTIVGLGGFAFTLGQFPTFRILADYWPVLLILLGILVLARSFVRPRPLQ
ncbi:MAG TPA: DUF5668 domain-containing protein [Anaerolineae bacterium]|nr:DUF5668 domain-containing protein [Anaerolineae bacterium]